MGLGELDLEEPLFLPPIVLPPEPAAVPGAADLIRDWIPTLLRKTSEHEGKYWSVQRNLDGQGVSYGILQWTQRGGGLGKLLAAMNRADPATFAAIFGADAQALLQATVAKSMGSVGGAVLWAAPWLARFDKAGRHPRFQRVQEHVASTTEYMTRAVEIARLLGVRTERAMVMFYNRTVHQGAAGAWRPAKALADWYAADASRRPRAANDIVAQYGWRCAASFRRASPPAKACYNESCTIKWTKVAQEYTELRTGDYAVRKVPVSGVWHAITGKWSLYDLITMRTSSILLDRGLRDGDVDLSVVGSTNA